MLVFSRSLWWFLLLWIPVQIFGQGCQNKLIGVIRDLSTGYPISFATIILENSKLGAISDSLGNYIIAGVCAGGYHIQVSHIGCEPKRYFVYIQKDTVLNIYLNHHQHLLENVVITDNFQNDITQNQHIIREELISENANQNLSTLIETIAGVNSLKTGGIAKPVIHGLYGNRVAIVNNGVSQSGQQWGNDHAPEIDPLSAAKITVIKGVGMVEYSGSSLGGVIAIEFPDIPNEPHLHGKINTYFESNGLGFGANFQAFQKNKWIAWRINGTIKNQGDKRTSSYFLRNTGTKEGNFSVKLQKNWSEKFQSEFFFSSFNTIIGILRGSHIGNITDLQEAMQREVPFFTESKFSYQIAAPRQVVNHNLIKFKNNFIFSKKDNFNITYFGQLNTRREYDVRRSGRSDIPTLSLHQLSQCLEGKYYRELTHKTNLKAGFQLVFTDNTNKPETGILPLIPDYLGSQLGVFTLLKKRTTHWQLEFGSRYSYENQRVVTITRGVPTTILRYNNHFNNYCAVLGANYRFGENTQFVCNVGFASRSPAINERYSFGLHQGLGSIEEGNSNLQPEYGVKATFGVENTFNKILFNELLIYYQNIQQYIFLKPQNEYRLTIRGAFPIFRYEQLNATICGFDYSTSCWIIPRVRLSIKSSFSIGYEQVTQNPLVYIPPPNIYSILSYQIEKFLFLRNIEIEVTNKTVLKQTNYLQGQDFIPPPATYSLLSLKITAQKLLPTSLVNVYFKIDNFLNTRYRDYLNRLRYFADDLGISGVLGVSCSF